MTTTAPLPPTFFDSISDDEESFVVLGTSLPPTSYHDDSSLVNGIKNTPIIDGSAVEEAITLVQTHLSKLSDSTSSFPSMPKVVEQDMVSLTDKLQLSTITTNSSVDLSPDEIQQKVDLLVEENIKLKETLHQNNLAMKHQYETLVLWQGDVMKVHQSHKEKFAETKKYIENLRQENARLTHALSLNNKSEEATGDLINTNLTEFELEAAQKKISSFETEIKTLRDEKLAWEKSCELKGALLLRAENLQRELQDCQNLHANEIAECKKQLQQSDSLQKILLDEIKMLKTKPADHTNCFTPEKVENIQEQLMAAQMHITKLEQLQNEDKELINDKEAGIKKLEVEMQEGIKKLQTEIHESKETMIALHQQVDLYKSDFEAERQLRQNLQADKEQIATDLQQLQRRNNQLLEEIERLRVDDYVHVNRLEGAISANKAPSAPQDNSTLSSPFYCPLCMSRFSTLQLVEEHVEFCINNTS